jgi:hypothetical protein
MAYLEQAIDIVAQRTIPASALNVMPTRTLTV